MAFEHTARMHSTQQQRSTVLSCLGGKGEVYTVYIQWPFVHTARRYYRLNGLVSFKDRWFGGSASLPLRIESNLLI